MTLGEKADKLAEEFGSTWGIFVLEMALRKACGVPNASLIKIDDVLIQDTPGYKQCKKQEEDELETYRRILEGKA